MLAESWDVSPDYKSIKLNLRKGVAYHDGREFTSDDVKYNFLRVRDPKVGAGAYVNQSNWFTSFDTPDKNTIILNSDQPRPLAFDLFERLYMLDKDTMEGPDAKTKANGTGPFTFVEWAQGDHFTTEEEPQLLDDRPPVHRRRAHAHPPKTRKARSVSSRRGRSTSTKSLNWANSSTSCACARTQSTPRS